MPPLPPAGWGDAERGRRLFCELLKGEVDFCEFKKLNWLFVSFAATDGGDVCDGRSTCLLVDVNANYFFSLTHKSTNENADVDKGWRELGEKVTAKHTLAPAEPIPQKLKRGRDNQGGLNETNRKTKRIYARRA